MPDTNTECLFLSKNLMQDRKQVGQNKSQFVLDRKPCDVSTE